MTARPSTTLLPGQLAITAIHGADLSMAVDKNCAGIAARETLALFGGKVDCGVELELYKAGSRGVKALRAAKPDCAGVFRTCIGMTDLFCFTVTSARGLRRSIIHICATTTPSDCAFVPKCLRRV